MGMTSGFGEEEENRYSEGHSMSTDDLIAMYIADLRERKGIGDKHAYDQQNKLTRLFAGSEATIQRFGHRAMGRYVTLRRSKGFSDATVRADVVAAKAMFTWLYRQKLFDKNLLENYDLPAIKETTDGGDAASKADLDGWLRANNEYYADASIHGAAAIAHGYPDAFRLRDQLITLIIADTAVRPVECMRIRLDQVKKDGAGT